MARDYWLEGDMVFVHMGQKYGLTETCRTICSGPVDEVKESPEPPRIDSQLKAELCDKPKEVVQIVPQPKPVKVEAKQELSVTKRCDICGQPFQAKRADAKCCSPKCRQVASRKNRQLSLV
jgi:hypothetical protein